MPAPVVLFVYNRLQHTRQTVEALLRNRGAAETELLVFLDGPRSEKDIDAVRDVRSYVGQTKGFRSIELIPSERNLGLATSIIRGVSEVLKLHGRAIVVEDDLVSSPGFLSYMNQGLDHYESEPQVASIHGYVYPVKGSLPQSFFLRGADCWGWATWKHAWACFEPDGAKLMQRLRVSKLEAEFDRYYFSSLVGMLKDQIEGRNDSWAIRWIASTFLLGKHTLYPGVSLIRNIGFDNSGRHCGVTTHFDVEIDSRSDIDLRRIPVEEDRTAFRLFEEYYRSVNPSYSQPNSWLWRLARRALRGT